jgi:hypothetical protein
MFAEDLTVFVMVFMWFLFAATSFNNAQIIKSIVIIRTQLFQSPKFSDFSVSQFIKTEN